MCAERIRKWMDADHGGLLIQYSNSPPPGAAAIDYSLKRWAALPMSIVANLAVPNHNFAIDDNGSGSLRSTKEHCPPRGHAMHPHSQNGMEIEREKVGAFTGFERTNIGASKESRAAESDEFHHLRGRAVASFQNDIFEFESYMPSHAVGLSLSGTGRKAALVGPGG
jgi:hypothetical protein